MEKSEPIADHEGSLAHLSEEKRFHVVCRLLPAFSPKVSV